MHPVIEKVTQDIVDRSHKTRSAYLNYIDAIAKKGPIRSGMGCGNLAHGFAACSASEKADLTGDQKANIAIITSYNDMLSAHQPYKDSPDLIKAAIREAGGVAQVAGGVPAMCDGITQGQPGMELSLFSRDLIAMTTAIGMSHNMFDGALYLGVCDKIVPGLLIGALSFGHLPTLFIPAGPMPSGLTNKEKARARQDYAIGKIGRKELLEAESASYHSPGTCTFYGTANSNQMMMEIMGLHLPGSSFINPYTPLRDELTKAAAKQVLKFTAMGDDYRPIAHMVSEKAIINAVIGLLATGGSTNHTMHLIAIARASGIILNWDDFDRLSKAIPLIAKIYPNGPADVNHFQAAGVCVKDASSSTGGRCIVTVAGTFLNSQEGRRQLIACQFADGTSGTKCNGLNACARITDLSKIGCGSCNGNEACWYYNFMGKPFYADVIVGENSCNGLQACSAHIKFHVGKHNRNVVIGKGSW
jgi:phosphogluconate dehydratase